MMRGRSWWLGIGIISTRGSAPTKTKRAREIDLTPYVAQVLKELKDKTGGLDSEPVFIRKGTRLSYDLVKSAHNKVSLRKGVTLQDIRHTYATIRIAKGDNIVDVSAQLGHKKDINDLGRVCSMVAALP